MKEELNYTDIIENKNSNGRYSAGRNYCGTGFKLFVKGQ